MNERSLPSIGLPDVYDKIIYIIELRMKFSSTSTVTGVSRYNKVLELYNIRVVKRSTVTYILRLCSLLQF